MSDHRLSIESIDPVVAKVKNSNEMSVNVNHQEWKDLNGVQSMMFSPNYLRGQEVDISNATLSPSKISVESKQEIVEMESRNHILKEEKPDLLNNNLCEESEVKFTESANKQNQSHYINGIKNFHNQNTATLAVKSENGFNRLITNKMSSETDEDQKTFERVLQLANEYMNTDFKIDLSELYFDCYNEKLSKDWIKTIKFNVTLEFKKKKKQILNSAEMNNKEEITKSPVVNYNQLNGTANLTEMNIKEEITQGPVVNNTQLNGTLNLSEINITEEITQGPIVNNTLLNQTSNLTEINITEEIAQGPVENNAQLRQLSNSIELMDVMTQDLVENNTKQEQISNLTETNIEEEMTKGPLEDNTKLEQISNLTETNIEEEITKCPIENNIQLEQISNLTELNNKDEKIQASVENNTQLNGPSNLTEMNIKEEMTQNDDTLVMENTLSDSPNNPSLCLEPSILTLKDIPTSFWITIHRADGFSEIWGQILEDVFYENMIELATDMQNFYETQESYSLKAVENSYYALKQIVWHRVKCIKIEEEKAHIMFIDRGDTDVVDVDKLQPLDSQFTLLPAQAINIRLTPLELFSDLAEANEILKEQLFEADVYVEVAATKNYSHYLSVSVEEMMIDHGKGTADLDNFTDLICIISNKIFKLVPGPVAQVKLNETFEAKVTHFCKPVGLYLQLCTKSLEYFNILMEKSIPKLDAFQMANKQSCLDANKLYFAKNEEKNWCRVKILKLTHDTIEAHFIDMGYIKLVRRSELILINKINKIMEKYPPQALYVKLDQIDVLDDEDINCLESLAAPGDVVHVTFKTVITNENPAPKVEMFKKKNNFLASINSTLLLRKKTSYQVNESLNRSKSYLHDESIESSKISTSSSDFNNSYSQKSDESRKMKLSFKKSAPNDLSNKKLSLEELLPPVQLPPEGSFFDCYVVRASHPSCFIIQILRNKAKLLSNLVRDISVACNNYKGKELSFETVEIGMLYACKSDDEYWYRVYVIKKSSPNEVVVYFCDDGYHKTVGIKNLIPLDKQFYKIPYQAIWAQLHGIKPTSPSWSATDSIQFRDMIQGKNIVCDIRGKTRVIEEDADGPSINKYIYQVELYDTSTPEDVNIGDFLVSKGICTRYK